MDKKKWRHLVKDVSADLKNKNNIITFIELMIPALHSEAYHPYNIAKSLSAKIVPKKIPCVIPFGFTGSGSNLEPARS